MHNLLILYNPYYNPEVIEDHIRVLTKAADAVKAKVGFGKVRSKRRDYEHPFWDRVDEMCRGVSPEKPLQLFLSDLSSVYVCYVENVSEALEEGVDAPAYYDALEVDRWFVVSDIREIARNDFGYVRDHFLSNLTTPNYGGHTYSLYGNRYDYPLMVEQKEPIDYFEGFYEGERHFTRVFKSSRYTQVQQDIVHYVFGKTLFYSMHPDSAESLISAELEYLEHKDDATYDFSTAVINYGKAFENESYYFLRKLFKKLLDYDPLLARVSYRVQGREYTLPDYLEHKPNIASNKYLLGNPEVFNAYKNCFDDMRKYAPLLNLLKFELKTAIGTVQPIRNEASHGGSTSRDECERVREQLMGVGVPSVLSAMLAQRAEMDR